MTESDAEAELFVSVSAAPTEDDTRLGSEVVLKWMRANLEKIDKFMGTMSLLSTGSLRMPGLNSQMIMVCSDARAEIQAIRVTDYVTDADDLAEVYSEMALMTDREVLVLLERPEPSRPVWAIMCIPEVADCHKMLASGVKRVEELMTSNPGEYLSKMMHIQDHRMIAPFARRYARDPQWIKKLKMCVDQWAVATLDALLMTSHLGSLSYETLNVMHSKMCVLEALRYAYRGGNMIAYFEKAKSVMVGGFNSVITELHTCINEAKAVESEPCTTQDATTLSLPEGRGLLYNEAVARGIICDKCTCIREYLARIRDLFTTGLFYIDYRAHMTHMGVFNLDMFKRFSQTTSAIAAFVTTLMGVSEVDAVLDLATLVAGTQRRLVRIERDSLAASRQQHINATQF